MEVAARYFSRHRSGERSYAQQADLPHSLAEVAAGRFVEGLDLTAPLCTVRRGKFSPHTPTSNGSSRGTHVQWVCPGVRGFHRTADSPNFPGRILGQYPTGSLRDSEFPTIALSEQFMPVMAIAWGVLWTIGKRSTFPPLPPHSQDASEIRGQLPTGPQVSYAATAQSQFMAY